MCHKEVLTKGTDLARFYVHRRILSTVVHMSCKIQIKEVTSQILTPVTRNRVCWIQCSKKVMDYCYESLDTDFKHKRRILTTVMYMSLYRSIG